MSDSRNLTLLTDLYELTMMQGYFKNHTNPTVVFDAFFRKNPFDSSYSIAAGLEQAIEYIKDLHFSQEDVDYLRSTRLFDEDFLEYLLNFRFPAISTRFLRELLYSRVSRLSRLSHLLWRHSLSRLRF